MKILIFCYKIFKAKSCNCKNVYKRWKTNPSFKWFFYKINEEFEFDLKRHIKEQLKTTDNEIPITKRDFLADEIEEI